MTGSDQQTAITCSRLKVALQRKGKPIPENDLWIAAIACQHKLPVVTKDKHFQEIDELEIEVW